MFSNQYRGIATGESSEEDALNDAGHNALKQIVEEVGVNVNAVFEMKKIEKGATININVESRTRAKAYGFIQDAKIVDTYIEKYKRLKPEAGYYYNAYVLVEIPEGEIERARERIKEFNQGIMKEARELWEEVKKEEESHPYGALLDYRSIRDILLDVNMPEAKALRIRAENRIEYLEKMNDPMMQLLGLKKSLDIINEVELTDEYGYPKDKFSLDVGDYLRVKLDLSDEGYLYIISYDKEKKQTRLLFPNRIERNNYAVKGVKVYPDSTCFLAEAPHGYNTMFIIISKEKIPIPSFTGDYISFTKEDMWRFLSALKKTQFDIENVEIYIRE